MKNLAARSFHPLSANSCFPTCVSSFSFFSNFLFTQLTLSLSIPLPVLHLSISLLCGFQPSSASSTEYAWAVTSSTQSLPRISIFSFFTRLLRDKKRTLSFTLDMENKFSANLVFDRGDTNFKKDERKNVKILRMWKLREKRKP